MSIFVISCNLSLPGEKRSDVIFDVDYINELSQTIILLSYKNGIILDRFEVKANSKKRFNNVTIKVNGERINVPFSVPIDSVLAIIDSEILGTAKYKTYLKQCDNIIFQNETKPCINQSSNDNLLYGYGSKSENSFQRKWYSLNKGEFLYRYTMDEKFFENAYKMYDYESRGL
jgi:hypothetical protein